MRPEKKAVTLSTNEKVIFEILKLKKSRNLNNLKAQSGLRNKVWDKALKGPGQYGLTKVTKTDDALIVEVAE